jgi:hypothetical protein
MTIEQQPWNFGTLEPWNFGTLEPGTLEPGTLEPATTCNGEAFEQLLNGTQRL